MSFFSEITQPRDKYSSDLYLCYFNMYLKLLSMKLYSMYFSCLLYLYFKLKVFKDSYTNLHYPQFVSFIAKQYFVIGMNHHLFMYYFLDRHQGYFQSGAVMIKLLLISFFLAQIICFYFFGKSMNKFLIICFQCGYWILNSC